MCVENKKLTLVLVMIFSLGFWSHSATSNSCVLLLSVLASTSFLPSVMAVEDKLLSQTISLKNTTKLDALDIIDLGESSDNGQNGVSPLEYSSLEDDPLSRPEDWMLNGYTSNRRPWPPTLTGGRESSAYNSTLENWVEDTTAPQTQQWTVEVMFGGDIDPTGGGSDN